MVSEATAGIGISETNRIFILSITLIAYVY